MCKILKDIFSDIADAIRAKKGTSNTITPDNMAGEIEGIPTGDNWCGEYDSSVSYYHPNAMVSYNGNIYRAMVNTPNLPSDTADWVQLNSDTDEWKGEYNGSPYYKGDIVSYNGNVYRATVDTDNFPTHSDWEMLNYKTKLSETIPTFTANGTYLASADGFDGYKGVTIDVPTGGGSETSTTVKLQGKTATTNGFVLPDDGYGGLSYVDVDIEHQPLSVTANGTYTASENKDSRGNALAGFSKVTVNVPIGGDNWKGEYNGSPYYEGDIVSYNGNVYRATVDTDNEPTHSDWEMLNEEADISETIPTFTANGTYLASADGFDGYKGVIIDVPTSSEIPDGYLKPTGTITIEKNGATDVSSYATANVQVPIMENKIITANGAYDAEDDGYAGFATVEIDVDKWKGEYTGSPYYEGDIVSYNGNVYRATVDTDNEPTHSDWEMLNEEADISETIPTFTANGTYLASDDGFDGYKGVIIDVPTGGGSETIETVDLLIIGEYPYGEQIVLPYVENGEIKYHYGYEALINVWNTEDSCLQITVPKGCIFYLSGISLHLNYGSATDLVAEGRFSYIEPGTFWQINSDVEFSIIT